MGQRRSQGIGAVKNDSSEELINWCGATVQKSFERKRPSVDFPCNVAVIGFCDLDLRLSLVSDEMMRLNELE